MMFTVINNEGRHAFPFSYSHVQGVTAMRCKRLLMLWLWLGLPVVSQGGVLTYSFEGNITKIEDSTGVLAPFHQGDRFVYVFSFDTNTPNIYPDPNPNAGAYDGVSSSLRVGGFSFETGIPGILIADVPGSDSFEVGSSIVWDRPELLPDKKAVSVKLTWGDVFNSPALPETPYDLGLFTYAGFGVQFMAPGGSTGTLIYMDGTIDSMYLLPEPTTGTILALIGLLVTHKRRRSQIV